MRIKSLSSLKKWNLNPTEEKPIVMEWFYDWIFDIVLKEKKFDKFKDAYDTMLEFTIKCEKINRLEAMNILNNNLKYWRQRANKDMNPFKKYFNKLLIMYNGI